MPVLAGVVATTVGRGPRGGREARRAAVSVVKAQVKIGGRGKAGGVKLAKTADEAADRRRADPRHGHQGPHGPPGDDRPGARRSPRSTTSPACSTAPTAPSSPWPPSRAAWRSRSSPSSAPRRSPGSRSTRSSGSTRRRPRRSSTPAGFPTTSTDQVADVIAEAVDGLRRRGRDAGRGQPAGQDRRRPDHRPRRQGDPRRERRLPPPRPRGARGQGRGRPARGGGQGQEPQLRQARRLGRHHRQRRRPGHVDPGRRRLRRRGVRRRCPSRPTSSTSAAAPRPRSWRTACEIILGDPQVEVGVRQRLRRHHRRATRSPTASSARSRLLRRTRPTKPLVVRLDGNNVEEGRAHPRRGQPPARRASSTPWTARPARPPSSQRSKGHDRQWRSSSPRTPRSSSRA